MKALEVGVTGIGVLGPGLAGWPSSRLLLCDPTAWRTAATLVPSPGRLPATERRRAGNVVKASIVVADEALDAAAGGGSGVGAAVGRGSAIDLVRSVGSAGLFGSVGSVDTARTGGPAGGTVPEAGLRPGSGARSVHDVVADSGSCPLGGTGAGLGPGLDPARIATVFASSTGDPTNCHLLCEALAAPQRAVSPTRFTNSVHNAPAGYWHIAAASRAPSTSLAAFDASFGAGLLEAAVQCLATDEAILLVACDVPYPEPLHAVRPLADVFAVALVIVPPGVRSGVRRLRLELAPDEGEQATPCDASGLEDLRQGIPAARALPLLQVLARDGGARLVLESQPGLRLRIDVGPR